MDSKHTNSPPLAGRKPVIKLQGRKGLIGIDRHAAWTFRKLPNTKTPKKLPKTHKLEQGFTHNREAPCQNKQPPRVGHAKRKQTNQSASQQCAPSGQRFNLTLVQKVRIDVLCLRTNKLPENIRLFALGQWSGMCIKALKRVDKKTIEHQVTQ